MPNSNGSIIASAQYAKVNRTMPTTIAPNTWTPATWAPAGLLKVYRDEASSPPTQKEKKMGWFRKKFNKWVRQAWEDNKAENYSNEAYIKTTSEGINGKTSIRFTVYPASGGYVIEHYKQDRYKDNEGPSLTIVPNGESIGTVIEHTITMEALKS